jgi:hypothetical protein
MARLQAIPQPPQRLLIAPLARQRNLTAHVWKAGLFRHMLAAQPQSTLATPRQAAATAATHRMAAIAPTAIFLSASKRPKTALHIQNPPRLCRGGLFLQKIPFINAI